MGVRRRSLHIDSLELPQFVRDPSLPGRCGVALVFYSNGPFGPVADGNGIRRHPGSFPADHRVYGGLPPASARQKAMVSFFWGRSVGFSLYGVNHRRCGSAMIEQGSLFDRLHRIPGIPGRDHFLNG